jgi:hypothetical protein
MGRLVHTRLGSSSLVAHVLQYPPPPHANSFVLGPAAMACFSRFGGAIFRDCEHQLLHIFEDPEFVTQSEGVSNPCYHKVGSNMIEVGGH